MSEKTVESVDAIESRVGRAVRQLRLDAGLSQDELADRTSLSRSAIQGLETGAGSRLATLIRVLRGLDRLDVLDDLTPRTGPTPMELLQAQRRASRTDAPRVRR